MEKNRNENEVLEEVVSNENNYDYSYEGEDHTSNGFSGGHLALAALAGAGAVALGKFVWCKVKNLKKKKAEEVLEDDFTEDFYDEEFPEDETEK